MTNIPRLNERFEHIERAYVEALAGRDPFDVPIAELLPDIYARVPDTNEEEIIEALCWSARKDLREADRLERQHEGTRRSH